MADQNGERRARLSRIALATSIALNVIGCVGATGFWIMLPERLRNLTERVAAHDAAIQDLRRSDQIKGERLAAIDERTKAIQETVSDIRTRLSRPH